VASWTARHRPAADAATRIPECPIGWDDDAVKCQCADRPGSIERMHRSQVGIRGRHHEGAETITHLGHHGQLIGGRIGQDTVLGSLQFPSAVDWSRLCGYVVEVPHPGVVGQGQGTRHGPGCDARKQSLPLLRGPHLPYHRDELGSRSQQGAGGDSPS
jgi:hypothetical protein